MCMDTTGQPTGVISQEQPIVFFLGRVSHCDVGFTDLTRLAGHQPPTIPLSLQWWGGVHMTGFLKMCKESKHSCFHSMHILSYLLSPTQVSSCPAPMTSGWGKVCLDL